MKILSLNQIRKVDQYCIDYESISSIELMERAAKSCFNWIVKNKHFQVRKIPFIVLSGNGKNGGDGLVLAKMLYLYGAKVSIYIVNISNHFSNEFLINKEKVLRYNIPLQIICEKEKFPLLDQKSYLIDAIFGIGLNRSVNPYWKSFFHYINEKKFQSVLSIDIPSGLFMEKSHDNFTGIIKATHTLTFQVPKLPFLFPIYANYVGKWWILNIGWKNDFLKKIHTKNFYIDDKCIYSIYKKKRRKFSHKGNYGHGMIIGGNNGMIGSVILAAKASFRTGIGKLSVHVPYCGYEIIQTSFPEVIVKTDVKKNWISDIIIPTDINAIGIGIGMGTHPQTENAFASFLRKIKDKKISMVVDADGLNILSNQLELLNILPNDTIITPHPKEFYRLFGAWKNDYQKLDLVKEISVKYKIFIILKGAHSIISTPCGNLYFNSTGNPGMATAGTGDVLTGMITSLLSQGYSPKKSCIMGVYLHGLSGDIAANKFSEESIISSDIIDHIGEAYQKITI
ncbi:carbohydrate kinase [Blattabacterium sp. (Blattella germanica) str. Bge]|uniref:bifunctional ADP-dependent NAD(P)H-hydrate dehydratase/NAD(P)H-hydrate epimerase n=1 Tax=Blattabacterium sp. (Blattella germanica) TaxID=624186 RepID=UPI0001BB6292|nr:bifunctional ADP-dependent NAD(P)H-hydrate dehydratase/NAD(P)H-hydrate epimerase [Blattabacterium sp. (Blattella germanica)]ACY40045.1 carbohydrate kinase [Blattabacterium sp. (Blattella germanica) str. Bge]